MIALIQRVTHASVEVNQRIIGDIKQGLLVFLGVEKNDTETQADRLIDKVLSYRVFADANDKMNLSVKDINGELLLVPQFTLAADTQSGNRPSFSPAASPEKGEALFNYCVEQAKRKYERIELGQFGADMKVSLLNDGPVTFLLQVKA
ncbi:MAG: D-aminoacyl-tRNA deacylase [Gammaproteobacteria bacterium]|nr:D-aminoacyl-tRNA deacylase [Gammaproteobacteria bacterium]